MLWFLPAALAVPSVDAPLRSGSTAPHDAAVVIGLETYPQLGIDVPYARRDARAFYEFLASTRGVPLSKVHLLESAGKEDIVAAVRTAGRDVGPGGLLWVYFAGHGAASQDKQQLILGDDVRPNPATFEARGLTVSALTELAGGVKTLLVLDTCYGGVGRGGSELVGGTRWAVPTYATKPAGDTTIWSATQPSEVAGSYDAARHGSFTYFALGALRGWADGELAGQPADGTVTLAEANAYVARSLRREQTRTQQPGVQGDDTILLATGSLQADPFGQQSVVSVASPEPIATPKPLPANPDVLSFEDYEQLGKTMNPKYEELAQRKRLESLRVLKQLKARASGPTLAEITLRTADMLWQEGRYTKKPEYFEQAIEQYEQLVRDFPTYERSDEALFLMGWSQKELGRNKQAVATWAALVKRYPSSSFVPTAYLMLGEQQSDPSTARRFYEKAAHYADHAHHPFALYKVAWSYFLSDERAKATEVLKKAGDVAEKKGKTRLAQVIETDLRRWK